MHSYAQANAPAGRSRRYQWAGCASRCPAPLHGAAKALGRPLGRRMNSGGCARPEQASDSDWPVWTAARARSELRALDVTRAMTAARRSYGTSSDYAGRGRGSRARLHPTRPGERGSGTMEWFRDDDGGAAGRVGGRAPLHAEPQRGRGQLRSPSSRPCPDKSPPPSAAAASSSEAHEQAPDAQLWGRHRKRAGHDRRGEGDPPAGQAQASSAPARGSDFRGSGAGGHPQGHRPPTEQPPRHADLHGFSGRLERRVLVRRHPLRAALVGARSGGRASTAPCWRKSSGSRTRRQRSRATARKRRRGTLFGRAGTGVPRRPTLRLSGRGSVWLT